jgi:protein disulfide-isomerase
MACFAPEQTKNPSDNVTCCGWSSIQPRSGRNLKTRHINLTMKKILVAILAITVFCRVNAGEAGWLTDLSKAETQAKSENKIVLMDFTGSDWCEWCIKFKKDVLDTDEFQTYAAKNVVLVELDFPNKKAQSDDLKKANAALKDKYNIEGFPTLIALDQNGKEIGRQMGYEEGGAKAFIAKLEKYKAGK